jgi:hypothetical protein
MAGKQAKVLFDQRLAEVLYLWEFLVGAAAIWSETNFSYLWRLPVAIYPV